MGLVRFVWSLLPICNLFLFQISSYETEYLNGTDGVINSETVEKVKMAILSISHVIKSTGHEL